MRSLLTAAFLAAFLMSAAEAAPFCDQRETVLSRLLKGYQERPTAVGVTNNGGLVEVLTSPEGETWSIIVSTPQGTSCLVAAGQWWSEKRMPGIGDRGSGISFPGPWLIPDSRSLVPDTQDGEES